MKWNNGNLNYKEIIEDLQKMAWNPSHLNRISIERIKTQLQKFFITCPRCVFDS